MNILNLNLEWNEYLKLEDYWSPMKITSKQVDIRDVYTASVGGQHTLFLMNEEKDKN